MTQNASRARCSRRLRDLRARRPADEERHDVPHGCWYYEAIIIHTKYDYKSKNSDAGIPEFNT